MTAAQKPIPVPTEEDRPYWEGAGARKLVLQRPGTLDPIAYDRQVADLVNYLAYMGEPAQADRKQWGILVLFFLAGFFVLAYLLKHEYWKDVR